MNFPRKPDTYAPCNQCGLCCVAEPCELALRYVETAEEGKPCPALEWEDGKSWCGLVRHFSRHAFGRDAPQDAAIGAEIREILGGGFCDATGGEGLTALEFMHMDALGILP